MKSHGDEFTDFYDFYFFKKKQLEKEVIDKKGVRHIFDGLESSSGDFDNSDEE